MSSKPFLILQLRPEDEAADDELAAFLKFGNLRADQAHRIRMDKDGIPPLNLGDYAGIIVGGGPFNVSDRDKPSAQGAFEGRLHELLDEIIARDIPYLGACYGLGILADHLGGRVSKEKYGEPVGAIEVMLAPEATTDPIMQGVPQSFRALGGHKEACQDVPPGATLLASSATCPVQVIRVGRNVYAAQFHTELDSAGLEVRINIYRHAGYFPPEDAEMLISAGHKETITAPMRMLFNFVALTSQK